ncbi:hypothetical protein [Burkholderia territorii]|uniref:hypothetical protein n=1 Tax=Burkholderia territorii TaxID=1503055 RepID=UPI0012D9EE19|nr:hypothetical protein [Burkholderia territorii]
MRDTSARTHGRPDVFDETASGKTFRIVIRISVFIAERLFTESAWPERWFQDNYVAAKPEFGGSPVIQLIVSVIEITFAF